MGSDQVSEADADSGGSYEHGGSICLFLRHMYVIQSVW